MKKLILGLLVCALMSAPALATITIQPSDGSNWTYQAWSFTAPPPPPAPSLGAEDIPADPLWVNPGAPPPPTADVALSIGVGIPPPGWYDNLFGDNHQGMIHGADATIDLHIPNIIDPRWTKIIQVEITYHVNAYVPGENGYKDALSYVTAGNDTYGSDVSVVDDKALTGGWRDVTIEWRIPQIYPIEVVHLYFINSIPPIYPFEAGYLLGSLSMGINTGVAIDRIEVATVCVPEPATLLLFGGAGLVGWLRRRRAL